MNDHLLRILTQDGSLRAAAAVTTTLVGELCRRQQTDPTAAVALGRLVTGAALLGGLLKGRQRLALMIEGNGPLQKLHAETDANGNLRASVKVPHCGLPLREGRLDVAGAVGRAGFLHVAKDLGLKEPYRGTVQLQSSEIAEDLAWYLTTSEQTPSAVALGVFLESAGSVGSAGGILLQAMPGCDPELLSLVEARLQALPPTSSLLREGQTPKAILERLFADIPYTVQAKTALRFRCSCSRDQALQLLGALPPEAPATSGQEPTVVTCEFCKERYSFTPAELAAVST